MDLTTLLLTDVKKGGPGSGPHGGKGKEHTAKDQINAEDENGDPVRISRGTSLYGPHSVSDKSAEFKTFSGRSVFVNHEDSGKLKAK